MHSRVVTKAVVTDGSGRVLLLRRSSSDTHRPGKWDFPGGGHEPGETFTVSVAREVREETALSIPETNFMLVYAGTNARPEIDESVTRLLFIAHLSADEDVVLSSEHDDFKWVDMPTALVELSHPFYSVALKYIDEHGLLAH